MDQAVDFQTYMGKRRKPTRTDRRMNRWKERLNAKQRNDVGRGNMIQGITRELSNAKYDYIALFEQGPKNTTKVAAIIQPKDYVAVGYLDDTLKNMTQAERAEPEAFFETLNRQFVASTAREVIVTCDTIAYRDSMRSKNPAPAHKTVTKIVQEEMEEKPSVKRESSEAINL